MDSSSELTSSGIRRAPENHILALDGIRGLAILLVLYHHLFWSNPNSGNRIFDFLNAIRASAFVGVNPFVVARPVNRPPMFRYYDEVRRRIFTH